ncbi:EXS family, partial [Rhizoctonia solani]
MKFARYLEDTQKLAHLDTLHRDYRGLKKKITVVKRANEAAQERNSDSRVRIHDQARSSITEPSPGTSALRRRNYGAVGRTPPNAIGRTPPGANGRTPSITIGRTSGGAGSLLGEQQTRHSISEHVPHVLTPPAAANRSVKSARFRLSTDELGPDFELPPAMTSMDSLKDGTIVSHVTSNSTGAETRRALPSRVFSGTLSIVQSRNSTMKQSYEQTGLNDTPISVPAPASVRSNAETRATPRNPFSGMRRRFTTTSRHNDIGYSPPETIQELLAGIGPNELAFFAALDQEIDKVEAFYSERERDAQLKVAALKEQFHELRGHKQLSSVGNEGLWPGFLHLLDSINIASIPIPGQPNAGKSADASAKTETPLSNPQAHVSSSIAHDPDAYQRAKKKLKKARADVDRSYSGLELLQNYRILNMTGFRKALKKFDKTAKVIDGYIYWPILTVYEKMSTQNLYMREKIEPCKFASGDTCSGLLKEIERIYATRFEKGNEKKARVRLRATNRQSTHHFSTFRSGMLIGLALPALAMGIYYSLQEERRELIPEWAALLQVYAALCIPVIFSLLLGLNLVAWARARINFIFIFELDARTVIDAREYIELPAFLFATLAYAFWLSFSRAGAETVAPTSWPIMWLGLTAVVLLNPFPIFHRSARWWLLRTVGKLFVSGRTRVEFTDFWMGDQFCSLVYTMGNLYFLVCAYADHWHHIEQRCQLGPHWTIPLVLTALPSLIRLVQCVRRYVDSKNHIHLINGGKYTASIVSYIAYYGWRHYGSNRDFRMGVWILFATINSCYTSYWDLMMDWSVLQVKGVQYKFLRKELAYSNHILAYYVAIVTNVVLRFIWIWYIPSGGLPAGTRAFMFAILEMLRRVQWNFFRLENEHIGNADQFRVTREVPLPYVFTGDRDSDDEDHGAERPTRKLSVRLPVMSKDSSTDVEAEGQ